MLINLSNHNSEFWSKEQIDEAFLKFGSIKDIKFPNVNPEANTIEVNELAVKYLKKIKDEITRSKEANNAVHLMGEFTFVYKLLEMLKQENILSVCSTTKRLTNSITSSKKISQFEFVRFREYY
jgi:hypothetical protein